MEGLAIAGIVLSAVAILISIVTAIYTKNQLGIAAQERNDRQKAEHEYADWAFRASGVVDAINRFYPRGSVRLNGSRLYLAIFQNRYLTQRIEKYLIRVSPDQRWLEARTLTPELLKLDEVRQTIIEIEQRFEEVKRTDKLLAQEADLL